MLSLQTNHQLTDALLFAVSLIPNVSIDRVGQVTAKGLIKCKEC